MEKYNSVAETNIYEPASDDDLAALVRLLDYAIEEAERQGLFVCAGSIREARHRINPQDDSLFECVQTDTVRSNPLLS